MATSYDNRPCDGGVPFFLNIAQSWAKPFQIIWLPWKPTLLILIYGIALTVYYMYIVTFFSASKLFSRSAIQCTKSLIQPWLVQSALDLTSPALDITSPASAYTAAVTSDKSTAQSAISAETASAPYWCVYLTIPTVHFHDYERVNILSIGHVNSGVIVSFIIISNQRS